MPSPADELLVVSPQDLAAGRVLPPDMLRDLRAVAGVGVETVQAVSDALKNESGVLTEERLRTLVSRFVPDDVVEAMTNTVQMLRPEIARQAVSLINQWRQASDERREFFSDEVFAALKRNLSLLAQEYPALLLMNKANRLLRDTGNEFDDVAYICDLRPVFDEAHERVEGFVTLAQLRLRYITQGGDRAAFELALTEDELSTLIEKSQDAMTKLAVLKRTAEMLGDRS